MKTKLLITLISFLLVPWLALADEVVPAESEDLSSFDALVKDKAEKQIKETEEVKPEEPAPAKPDNAANHPDNFGKSVSTQAKDKESIPEGYKNFGQYISEQAKAKAKKNASAKKDKKAKKPKTNIGKVISEEAKKLKDKQSNGKELSEKVRELVRERNEKNKPEAADKGNKAAIGEQIPEAAGSAGKKPDDPGAHGRGKHTE